MLKSIKFPLYRPRKSPRKLVVKMCTYTVESAVFKYTEKNSEYFARERIQIQQFSDLYFYKNQKDKITVSVTRSQNIKDELMFFVQITEEEGSINFKIKNQAIQRRPPEESDSDSEQDKIPMPYLVVRQKKQLLKAGMKVKLGFTKLHIKEIFVGEKLKEVKREDVKPNEQLAESNRDNLFYVQKDNAGPEDKCRICYEKQTQDNLLLNLCICSGDIKYIHMQCLCLWINKILKKKNQGFIEEKNFQDLLCDICKKPYPQYFEIRGKIYLLLSKTLPASISFLHKYSLEKKSLEEEMTFGKDKSLWYPIRFDSRISNKHAHLDYDKQSKKVWISDLGSDYGTLIHHKNLQFSLSNEEKNTRSIIQFGNIIFMFELRNN